MANAHAQFGGRGLVLSLLGVLVSLRGKQRVPKERTDCLELPSTAKFFLNFDIFQWKCLFCWRMHLKSKTWCDFPIIKSKLVVFFF